MYSEKTTKQNPTIFDLPSVQQESRHDGYRYFCASCLTVGRTPNEPTSLCHRCGRLICEACRPQLTGWRAFLLHHSELKWLKNREDGSEAAHCAECVHDVPRMGPWVLVGFFGVIILINLLYLLEIEPATMTILTLFLFVVWVATALLWQMWGKRHQELFFPVIIEQPELEIEEFFEVEVELDHKSTERFQESSPRGHLKVTLPLHPKMTNLVEVMAEAHHLSDEELEKISAKAGAVIVEHVSRITHETMRWTDKGARLGRIETPWPTTGSRRWELSTLLPQWPLIWTGKGNHKQNFTFPYCIDWWDETERKRRPFPIQLQANVPEESERQSIVLHFYLHDDLLRLNPSVRKIIFKQSDELPDFRVMDLPSRMISQSANNQIEITNPHFSTSRISLQLRFAKELPNENPTSLTGFIHLEIPSLLSGMTVEAYYNAFGEKQTKPNVKNVTHFVLHFRINLAALPYQRTSRYTEELILAHSHRKRDEAILEALSTQNPLVYLSQQHSYSESEKALPPSRQVFGYWHLEPGDEVSPLVFQLQFNPAGEETHLRIHIESPVPNNNTLEQVRAAEYGHKLRQVIMQTDERFWSELALAHKEKHG